MYPIHLEKALESLWKVEFERYTKKLKAELFRLIELGEKKTVQDSDFSVRWDGDLPREVIEFFARRRESKLRGQSPGSLGRSTSQKVLAQLMGWANTQVSAQLESQSSAMKMPAGAISERQTFSESQKRNFRVPALGLSPSALGQYLSDHGRHLQNLQATLFQEHENSLQNVVMGHLKKGERISTLKESIERQMDVDSSKAGFWARDQAGKFYGSVNREAQIRAGFTGYIWRTMKDNNVRDAHKAKHVVDQYHSWRNPPLVGSQHYHPGEDYNCRCYAEPARDPGVSRDPIRVLGGPDPQPQGLQRNLQPREQGGGEYVPSFAKESNANRVAGRDEIQEFKELVHETGFGKVEVLVTKPTVGELSQIFNTARQEKSFKPFDLGSLKFTALSGTNAGLFDPNSKSIVLDKAGIEILGKKLIMAGLPFSIANMSETGGLVRGTLLHEMGHYHWSKRNVDKKFWPGLPSRSFKYRSRSGNPAFFSPNMSEDQIWQVFEKNKQIQHLVFLELVSESYCYYRIFGIDKLSNYEILLMRYLKLL